MEMQRVPLVVADQIATTWAAQTLLIPHDLGDDTEAVYENFIDLRRARVETVALANDLIEVETINIKSLIARDLWATVPYMCCTKIPLDVAELIMTYANDTPGVRVQDVPMPVRCYRRVSPLLAVPVPVILVQSFGLLQDERALQWFLHGKVLSRSRVSNERLLDVAFLRRRAISSPKERQACLVDRLAASQP